MKFYNSFLSFTNLNDIPAKSITKIAILQFSYKYSFSVFLSCIDDEDDDGDEEETELRAECVWLCCVHTGSGKNPPPPHTLHPCSPPTRKTSPRRQPKCQSNMENSLCLGKTFWPLTLDQQEAASAVLELIVCNAQ